MLVHPGDAPRVTRTFDAHLVWLNETPLDPGKSYFIKHTTQTSRVNVDCVQCKKDLDTLGDVPTDTLACNEIGRATLTAHRALFLDGYRESRETGSFILIDSITNATVAAGMVIEEGARQDLDRALEDAKTGDARASRSQVSVKERRDGSASPAPSSFSPDPSAGPRRRWHTRSSDASSIMAGAASSCPQTTRFDRIPAARAVADAGLMAVVSLDAALLDAARAGLASDEARLLVVRSIAADAAPGKPLAGAVDLAATSVEEGAGTVIKALRARGWIA